MARSQSKAKTGSLRRASPVVVALAAAACAGDPAPAASEAAPAQLPPCVLERRPLAAADGTEMYIEYEDLIFVGDEALVAGAPSYHWRPVPGRLAERLSSNEFVAAYLGPPARPVTRPIEGALTSVRVAALDDRRWGAILHEVDPDSLPAIELFRGLWYGEFDGERWTHLESMEYPGTRLTSRISSGLVRAGERLVWLAFEPVREQVRTRVHVYERVAGTWSHYVLPNQDRVEQAALAYLDGSGLWMLLSGYDAGLPGFQKSLRLYREHPSAAATSPERWELVSRVAVAEPEVTLRTARLALQPNRASVSWMAVGGGASRAMARFDIGADSPGIVVTLDEFATFARPASMPDGTVVWIVDHWQSPGIAPEFRLLGIHNGQATRLASFPSPFTAALAVSALAPEEVLVVGPEMSSDSIGVPVRSLILRLSTSC
jgi:hypothetical protein